MKGRPMILVELDKLARIEPRPEARAVIPANTTLDFYLVVAGVSPCPDGCYAKPGERCEHGKLAWVRADYR